MLRKATLNALITLALTIAFYLFFMFTKHDAMLSKLIPFAFDPYDALGSFALETTVFLGALSSIRTIKLYRRGTQDTKQQILIARTQMGIALSVLLTLIGDIVAMLRHLSRWIGQPASSELLFLTVVLALFALVVGIVIFVSARHIGLPQSSGAWKKGIVIMVAMVIVLAFYPENLTQSMVGELLTVIIGAVLLFVPLWALGNALFPDTLDQTEQGRISARFPRQWLIVTLLGIGIGLFLVLGEATENGKGILLLHSMQIVFVYAGLEVSAVLIGYSLLRKQLGLFQDRYSRL